MKTEVHSALHFAFPAVIVFSLCLQTSANHTDYPGLRNGTWNPISQNLSGSQSLTEDNTNPPLGINSSSRTVSLGTQTNSLQFISSTVTPNSTSLPASTTGGLGNSSKPQTNTTKETCEDNKPLILICFIVIAVLVLICTFLLLSTVVMANKMSYLKKAQQGKRRPRSNGDLLATNSFWPTTAGTWQRMPKEPAGTDLIMQELIAGRGAASQRKAEEKANEQENKSPKSHKPILANFVVEIWFTLRQKFIFRLFQVVNWRWKILFHVTTWIWTKKSWTRVLGAFLSDRGNAVAICRREGKKTVLNCPLVPGLDLLLWPETTVTGAELDQTQGQKPAQRSGQDCQPHNYTSRCYTTITKLSC